MKRVGILTTTEALMLNLGVAIVYAQQVPVICRSRVLLCPARLRYSPAHLRANTNITGTGTLGPFTFTELEATSQPPGTCPATDHSYSGAGVFRFQDGSLLMVSLTQGSNCLQFTSTSPVAHCTTTFQVTGATGRFKNASGGTIALTETVLAVLFDASSNSIRYPRPASGEFLWSSRTRLGRA